MASPSGILILNKPPNKTSFNMVAALRRILGVQKIGHAGTLDPFATGVLILLIGKEYTKLSNQFLNTDKEYITRIKLGMETDTYDCVGKIVSQSSIVPTLEQILDQLPHFQGKIEQVPPMFSAKKVNGKKLYELARQGKEIERKAETVEIDTKILAYAYPHLDLQIRCSKGTYIRSIGHELGKRLGCGAHVEILQRIRSGGFHLKDCIDGSLLDQPDCCRSLLNSALLKNIECT